MKNEELKLDDSVKTNKRGEAILGRLTGPCADIIHPTRNGRVYSEELWEKVFNNDITKEYFEAGGILGELDHPADRLETCTEKVAICMPEPPVKNDKGQLIGTWDILDTPNGRIAYTLAKYGYKLGISSRGNGDVYSEIDGTDRVDEDTYDFQAFDLVLLPAVKSARLKMVESLQVQNGKTFKQALCEALNRSNPEGRKIQEETLKNLNIDYTPERVDNKESTNDSVEEIKDDAVVNDKADSMNDLTEALKENKQLKNRIKELQEQLSVCYTKEKSREVEIGRLKNCIVSLTEDSKSLKVLRPRLDSLKEQLDQKNLKIKEQSSKIEELTKNHSSSIEKQKSLKESLNSKEDQIEEIKSQNIDLRESLSQHKKEASETQRTLIERVEELKKDSSIKKSEFNSKLEKANSLIEKYQKIAKNAVDKLIESKSVMLGVSPNEIKSRLPKNYSFKDIDNICEELQQYRVNLSKIPLAIKPNLSEGYKIETKKSVEPIIPRGNNKFDDTVDDSLLTLAGLKNN